MNEVRDLFLKNEVRDPFLKNEVRDIAFKNETLNILNSNAEIIALLKEILGVVKKIKKASIKEKQNEQYEQ